MANPRASAIVPAQLGFLAIYNPGLGTTDETVDDQIVYYASASTIQASAKRRRRHHPHRHGDAARDGARPAEGVSKEELNERLRQIGLAQGMVEFARSFSGGRAVDSIDTERTRVVLHELEPGWWILASIDLTRLPLPPGKENPPPHLSSASSPSPSPFPSPSLSPGPHFEYSSREVKPPALLLQDLLRAHTLFLLHHGRSLSALFSSVPRPRFAALLARYWDAFLPAWSVLLHGNPACGVLGGIKIAACGELGIGVGEEDRGSAEREVLEGLVERVAGLADLVVGRFGEQAAIGKGKKEDPVGGGDPGPWLGAGNEVGAEDGAVFLGVGALSRRSLRALTWWMEDIYTWGEGAYGVADSLAGAGSRKRRRKAAAGKADASRGRQTDDGKPDGPEARPPSSDQGTGGDSAQPEDLSGPPGPAAPDKNAPAETGGAAGMDKMLSYLKLGYGTYWSLGASSPGTGSDVAGEPARGSANAAESVTSQNTPEDVNSARFLIGLDEHDTEPQQPPSPAHGISRRRRCELTVELETEPGNPSSDRRGLMDTGTGNSHGRKKATTESLLPVVYVHRPFIFILLFQPDVPSPPWEELSQILHAHLSPLHKRLLASTAYRPDKPDIGRSTAAGTQGEIYDLVFDPASLTIHSTIPNIPEPVPISTSGDGRPSGVVLLPPPSQQQQQQQQSRPPPWTRLEALSTHIQIVHTFASTRGGDPLAAQERTCKTSRGWWVVWNRVPVVADSGGSVPPPPPPPRLVLVKAAAAAATTASSFAGGGSERQGGDEEEMIQGGTVRGKDEGLFLQQDLEPDRRPDHDRDHDDQDQDDDHHDHDQDHDQDQDQDQEQEQDRGAYPTLVGKEIFLVRRASDRGGAARSTSMSYAVGGGGGGGGGGGLGAGGWADGAARLAQGIGVDTKRYIEGLLSLNR